MRDGLSPMLRLAPDVRWRAYWDGLVVYVGETCETHILPPDFQTLFESPAHACLVDEPGMIESALSSSPQSPAVRVSRKYVKELVELKIFDWVN